MKIVLVAAHWPPRLSGHGDFSAHLAQALSNERNDVVAVPLGEAEPSEIAGIEVRPEPFPGSIAAVFRLARIIANLEPDVVCLQFESNAFRRRAIPHLLPLAIRLRRVRVVMTYHELWPPRVLKRLAKLVLLNAAHRVVVFSEWHAQGVERFRRRGSRCDIVAVGSNIVREARGDSRLIRARYGIPVETAIVTMFGFIGVQHLPEVVLEAVGLLRSKGLQIELSVIGAFDPLKNSLHQDLLQLSQESGIADHTTWHGRAEPEEIARLLTITDVGVVLYDQGAAENNGAIAAFAEFEVPIVTTGGERTGRLAAEGIAEVVEPTPQAVADAIERQLSTQSDTARKAAREWAERRRWNHVARAYQTVFTGGERVDLR